MPSPDSPSLNPPTSQLPPIAKINSATLQEITSSISYLRYLYNPEVRGSRLIDRKIVFASALVSSLGQTCERDASPGRASTSPDSAASSLDTLRADDFERSYAIRWLTSLVSKSDTFVEAVQGHPASASDGDDDDAPIDGDHVLAWEKSIQDAAALLAVCAGTASAGTVSRTFAFRRKPIEDQCSTSCDCDLKVQITDVPLENHNFSSVGAQTWGSACLLAEMVVDSPRTFGLGGTLSPTERKTSLRILEIGAGTGLVGLTISGFLGESPNRPTTVVLTDFHPTVLQNLANNIELNTSHWSRSSSISVEAQHLDWSDLPPSSGAPPPLDLPFDIIFGADVVYEIEHAKLVRSCVERFLRRPTSGLSGDLTTPCFHLVIPLRPTHDAETKAVEELFPFAEADFDYLRSGASTLKVVSKEVLVCRAEDGSRGRAANVQFVEYAHYTIVWV